MDEEDDAPDGEGRIEVAYQDSVTLSPKLKLHFACVSLRGFYPDDADKENQDSHVEIPLFSEAAPADGEEEGSLQSFFGVFDGHGSDGHGISRFTRDVLPAELLEAMKQYPSDFSAACREAFLRTDAQVERAASMGEMDDEMSGTTAVCVLISDSSLRVANTGDSRVIIGQRRDDKLLAYPLSIDQTPYRQDEYQRTRACGARVMSGDQLDGMRQWHDDWEKDLSELNDDESDPPRLWLPDDEVPGCAFTRSIGDRLAKQIGVIALPELLDKEVTPSDEYIVLCSDGVFEFISNQMAMDIVAVCDEPLAACQALVQEAYKLWLQYDVRTDDITAIVLKLEHLVDGAPGTPRDSSSSRRRSARRVSYRGSISGGVEGNRRASAEGVGLGLDVISGEQMRPIRRVISKEKRKVIVSDSKQQMPDMPEATRVTVVGKIEQQEIERVRMAVASNFLFSHLERPQQEEVLMEMERVTASSNDVVIQQGERGDWFYVVDDGKLDVLIKQEDGQSRVVYTYDATIKGIAPSFGDLALLYQQARAGTVIARSECRLWRLHREVFRRRLQKSSNSELIKVLRQVDILSSLSFSELQQLVESLSQQTYEPGDVIIQQGEMSSAFYIVRSGEVALTQKVDPANEAEQPKEIMRLTASEQVAHYFGERALLLDAPRAATATAVTALELLYIRRDAFELILGPLEVIINHDRRRREKVAYLHQLQTEALTLISCNLSSFFLWPSHASDEVSSTHICESFFTGRMYTMQIWSKTRILEEMQQRRVMNAACMLSGMKSPPSRFLPQPICVFEEQRRLCAVYSTRIVCDLGSIYDPKTPFDDATSAFYNACILLALEALQYESIVLRTVSIETLVLTAEGLLQLCDFRVAKNLALTDAGRTYTLCGSPHYFAPEIITGKGHGCEVDLWALGVVTFELLHGEPPFDGETELELYENIRSHAGSSASHQPDKLRAQGLQVLEFPPHFSEEVCDLLDTLLSPSPSKRHGGGGAGLEPLRQHLWYDDIVWEALANGEIEGPHVDILRKKLHAASKQANAEDEQAIKRKMQNHKVPDSASMKWCEDFEFLCRFYSCQNTTSPPAL